VQHKPTLITKTFQAKKDVNNFDLDKFKDEFLNPFNKIRESKVFFKTYIIVNTEIGNQNAEIKTNGISASQFYLNQFFYNEIKNDEIIIVDFEKWISGSRSPITWDLNSDFKSLELNEIYTQELELTNYIKTLYPDRELEAEAISNYIFHIINIK